MTADAVRAALKSVVDPELGINVVDLGLIYDVRIDGGRIEIDLTLTNPECPMAGLIAGEVEQAARGAFEDAEDVEVGLVFDPPWTFDRLSEEGKQALGYEKRA